MSPGRASAWRRGALALLAGGLLPAAGGVALAGCGAADPRPAVRRALARLERAASAGDPRAACPSLLFFPPGRPRAELVRYARTLGDEAGRADLGAVEQACRETAAAVPRQLLGALGSLAGVRVGAVRMRGPLAAVTLRGPAGPFTATFVRAPGGWRLLLGPHGPAATAG